MKYVLYIIRFFWKIRFWLIIIPLLVAIFAYLRTSNLERYYEVSSDIYTGVVSGYSGSESVRMDGAQRNAVLSNVMQVIKSDYTLKRVSMRLYARSLMNGNPSYDNVYLNASTYKYIVSQTPKYIFDLIVEGDEEKTVQNFFDNMRPNNRDFLYGIYLWEEGLAKIFGKSVLQEVIVQRYTNSDILGLYFKGTDPGITYQTLMILIDEFQKQYNELQYGETNDVIKYFEQELSRQRIELKTAEDDLTRYNIQNKVINYTDETKEVAAINKEFELLYNQIQLQHAAAKAYVDGLQQRIEGSSNTIIQNTTLIANLNRITQLQVLITNLEAFGERTEENTVRIEEIKEELYRLEEQTRDLTTYINEAKYSSEGVTNRNLIENWINQTIELSKAEAQVDIMNEWKRNLDQKFLHYAPIGSTIKSKEREIAVNEKTYYQLQEGLNSAILRLKQIQMSSNNIKVTNYPDYPINPLPHKRKMIILLAFVASFVFVIAFFFFIEFFDRTLRDILKAELLTGAPILGAMPGLSYRFRGYNRDIQEIAAHKLATSISPLFGNTNPVVINILSIENADGKHFVAEKLKEYWESYGMSVRLISHREDFDYRSKEYLLATGITDLVSKESAKVNDIILIVHQAVVSESIPPALLNNVNLNLLITRSSRTWKNTDQETFEKMIKASDLVPFHHILNYTSRDVAESFTGLLPPYTKLRKFFYKLSQLGLTSSDNYKTQKS